MWEYRLEYFTPGQQLPRYSQLFTGTDAGLAQAKAWKVQNCETPGGSFCGNPDNFKRNTDRGNPAPKADRTLWIVFYEEFLENDFGLEIP